jgi:transcription elongation factor Elf1
MTAQTYATDLSKLNTNVTCPHCGHVHNDAEHGMKLIMRYIESVRGVVSHHCPKCKIKYKVSANLQGLTALRP